MKIFNLLKLHKVIYGGYKRSILSSCNHAVYSYSMEINKEKVVGYITKILNIT